MFVQTMRNQAMPELPGGVAKHHERQFINLQFLKKNLTSWTKIFQKA